MKIQLKFVFSGLYSSPNLQKVSLKVMDNETCDQMFLGGRKTLRLPEGIHNSMLCAAGYLDSSHDTCQVRLFHSWDSKHITNCIHLSYQSLHIISIICYLLTTHNFFKCNPMWQHLWTPSKNTLLCACTVCKTNPLKSAAHIHMDFLGVSIFQSTE